VKKKGPGGGEKRGGFLDVRWGGEEKEDCKGGGWRLLIGVGVNKRGGVGRGQRGKKTSKFEGPLGWVVLEVTKSGQERMVGKPVKGRWHDGFWSRSFKPVARGEDNKRKSDEKKGKQHFPHQEMKKKRRI